MKSGRIAQAMASDLHVALESAPPTLAKALYPLIAMAEEDIQPTAHTALQFARLLNEARIIITEQVSECAECEGSGTIKLDVPDRALKAGEKCPECFGVREFLDRCTEQLGPIVERRG